MLALLSPTWNLLDVARPYGKLASIQGSKAFETPCQSETLLKEQFVSSLQNYQYTAAFSGSIMFYHALSRFSASAIVTMQLNSLYDLMRTLLATTRIERSEGSANIIQCL